MQRSAWSNPSRAPHRAQATAPTTASTRVKSGAWLRCVATSTVVQRAAGSITNVERIRADQYAPAGDSDLLCPGPMFVNRADTARAIDDVAELYLYQLRRNGWRYADQIRMRDHYSDRPAYRLMFATGSPHGIELMSDIAYRYEQSLQDEEAAGALTLWHDHDARQRLVDLRDRVYATGLAAGTASREQLIHTLAPQLFGRYTSTEYAKAIREVVQAGLIDRPNAVGIEPREPLQFIEPPQTSLFA